ncbi:MAG: di-heme oxidoredictase family protein [Kofleriaceae bacterium]
MRFWLLGALALLACGDNVLDERQQGGATTIDDRTAYAFDHPAANLSEAQREIHVLGRGPFLFQWRTPQLGPLFNNDACGGCHGGMGRGLSQIGPGPGSQALVRVSMVAGTPDEPGGPVPVPGFGLQLQDHASFGLPEVHAELMWAETSVLYGDGEVAMLRVPTVEVRLPSGEPLGPNVRQSYRQGPPVIGLGLLEAIPEDTLLALADPDDDDGDGISGRANQVWSPTVGATVIGRFGHKANVATLREQTAGAFVNDIGLTNALFAEPDGMRDVNDEQLVQTTFLMSTLAVPIAAPRSAAAQRGRLQFDELGCASCHVPTLVTGDHVIPQLANQTIHPYTDLLLHDVGDALTDARVDFLAEGVEWRTPPLWGIGLTQVVLPEATFLHDGRARTLAEAILWHAGEAMAAREAFRMASKADRDALIAFLQTL